MKFRIPRKVNLGRGYFIPVMLVGKLAMREIDDEDSEVVPEGIWESSLGQGLGRAGTIYIGSWVGVEEKWRVYWHELTHAMNDISAYDQSTPLLT